MSARPSRPRHTPPPPPRPQARAARPRPRPPSPAQLLRQKRRPRMPVSASPLPARAMPACRTRSGTPSPRPQIALVGHPSGRPSSPARGGPRAVDQAAGFSPFSRAASPGGASVRGAAEQRKDSRFSAIRLRASASTTAGRPHSSASRDTPGCARRVKARPIATEFLPGAPR